MLKIFAAPKSIALASVILLEEIEADYEITMLDFSRNEQRDTAYQAINPKGRVPALATEDGILTETPAILLYLAQRFGADSLTGAHSPFVFAQIQEFNSYLASTVHVAHAHRLRGSRWTDDPQALEALKTKVPESMAQVVRLIEDEFLQGPWVMGEAYTICDPYLFTICSWLEDDGVDTTRLPRILAHRQQILQRPATQAALSQLG
ncbi:MAG TPA: glutathione S-transferase [Arenicellales bacterium]|nr:glutathione S-transferase [Arenicellales bacterium]HJP08184.1 glutathione S-transferase [Arenicellales bacterium]